jgi:hypothetical protein
MINEEIIITYPRKWEEEYRKTRFVALWRHEYPAMFADYRGSANPRTLDLFPQYALMFLLRRDHNIHSLTWFKLAGKNDLSKVPEKIRKRWHTISKHMGRTTFNRLQAALRKAGFREFKGEPDLFCWHPETGNWFFAEAKGKDNVTHSEREWCRIYRDALGDEIDIRVYRLRPKP